MLYLLFSAARPFIFSPTDTYPRALIMFDIDCSPETGYLVELKDFSFTDPKRQFGSDLLISGQSMFRQEAGSFNAGSIGTVVIAPDSTLPSDSYELAVPLSILRRMDQSSITLRIVFFSDGNEDYAPQEQHSIVLAIPARGSPVDY
jgi:hypothetical protein